MRKTNRDYTGLVRTPSSMVWLISERARLRGALERVDKMLEELPRQRVQLLSRLEALDQVIPLHKVKVDPQEIVGVRPQRPNLCSRGVMTRVVLEFLRKAEGTPQRTADIALYVAQVAGIDVSKVGRRDLVTRVRHRLKRLRNEGVLTSLHDLSSGAGEEGLWALRSDEDQKAA